MNLGFHRWASPSCGSPTQPDSSQTLRKCATPLGLSIRAWRKSWNLRNSYKSKSTPSERQNKSFKGRSVGIPCFVSPVKSSSAMVAQANHTLHKSRTKKNRSIPKLTSCSWRTSLEPQPSLHNKTRILTWHISECLTIKAAKSQKTSKHNREMLKIVKAVCIHPNTIPKCWMILISHTFCMHVVQVYSLPTFCPGIKVAINVPAASHT